MRRWPVWAGWFALAVLAGLTLAAILLIRGISYWGFSDGVYLYSSRALLHGADPYSGFAAAQPPPIYYLGAGILGIGDSITVARIALGLVELATCATVFAAVRGLTGNERLAVIGGVAALLTPRTLHDSASLVPETFVAPLVMSAALLSARSTRNPLAGLVTALAVSIKLAYVLPALAIAVVAVRRGAYLLGFVASGLGLGLVFLLAFGADFVDGAVGAQRDLGLVDADRLGIGLLQAAWNLLPFGPAVVAAWILRSRAKDPALMRSLWAAAAGSLAVFATVVKYGTDINLAVVAEPPLLALGVAGLAWAWQGRRAGETRSRRLAVSGLVAATLGAGQALSLLISPSNPFLFSRPGSSTDKGWALSPAAVEAEVARIDRCPPGVAYSGDPYLAFAAHRRMPGDQGDSFIIRTKTNARFLALANADRPRCPSDPAQTHNSAIIDNR